MLKTIALLAATVTAASASDPMLRGNSQLLATHGDPCAYICDPITDAAGKNICKSEAEKDDALCKPCADCHEAEAERQDGGTYDPSNIIDGGKNVDAGAGSNVIPTKAADHASAVAFSQATAAVYDEHHAATEFADHVAAECVQQAATDAHADAAAGVDDPATKRAFDQTIAACWKTHHAATEAADHASVEAVQQAEADAYTQHQDAGVDTAIAAVYKAYHAATEAADHASDECVTQAAAAAYTQHQEALDGAPTSD